MSLSLSKCFALVVTGSLLLMLATPSHAQQIYKKRNADGSVTYTDQKQAGAEEVKVETVVSEFATLKRADSAIDTNSLERDESVTASVSITSPRHEQTIRDNEGDVTVSWQDQVENLDGDPQFKLYFNNQLTYEGPANSITMSGLPRGEHRLMVRMFDEQGTTLAQSSTVTFYLHQASVLNPAINNAQGGTGGQN